MLESYCCPSNEVDHAVHQLQPPKAVCSPLCFFKVCDFFLFVCFLHGNIVTAFFLFSVVL
uniref:Uncharacterized protein n=1 Tax=Strix occidentalis caurina TaxID=311401 RepID=A0A8D0FW35_STROC